MKVLILLPIIIGASLNLYARNLKDASKFYQNPIANAGSDKIIYLTQTNSVTLDGSASSGDSYQWAEISTDYMSGAIISSPNSKVTTIAALLQGVFYFELAVTTSGTTRRDTMVVRVDYDVPPANATLFKYFDISDPLIYKPINNRTDTINYYSVSDAAHSWAGVDPNRYYLFRARANGLTIDPQKGKFISTNEDGYAGENANRGLGGYPRCEVEVTPSSFTFDTSHTYMFEWKGYFPQDTNYLVTCPDWARVLTIFQVHGGKYDYAISNFDLRPNGIYYNNEITGSKDELSDTYPKEDVFISSVHDFYNKSHTLRITMREGLAYLGQKAFIKVELDGATKYFRNTGGVGSAYFDDYVKFGSIYDWRSWITRGDSLARGRKFSLVTESFKIYKLNETPTNIPPVADVGSDRVIQLPKNSIALPGSGTDADGIVISYLWTQLSGPTATLTNRDSANAGAWNLIEGNYQFQLIVTDNKGATGSKLLNVTVNAIANISPTADAGTNQTITLPTNTVTLNGSGTDPDGTIASYSWAKISGPSIYNIANASSAITTVSGLLQGTYQFELAVTDDKGGIDKDTVQVKVNAAPNISPTADAGINQLITLPENSVNISGSGSDADGTVVSYHWTKISGPPTYNIDSQDSATTNISDLVQGVYYFQLIVTDNNGGIGTASVRVSVNATANQPPTASAESNQIITLPTDSVNLLGSGSDADGTIVSYYWTKISGPSTYNIANPNADTTIVSGLAKGVYQFQFTVTDNSGDIGTAIVWVTVDVAANMPPTADAGSNQSITLPINSVNLSGSGTDADGTIASYQWTIISGPSTYNIVNPSSAVTDITGLTEGVYTFQLSVTDNSGDIDTASVEITVNAQANIPPTANAGANQTIALPANIVSLAGSSNDADGTITSYQWTKISGPSAYNIVNPDSALTNVSDMEEGVYQFQLTVTDNGGAIGTDIVQVTITSAVNVPPTANAGSNISISLPTDSASLAGSGSDADGTITSYQWTKISGPSSFNIVSPDSALTNVSGLVQGVYQFQLTVTDNKGEIGTATVQVAVNATPNIPPTANAGSNKNITLPTNNVSLAGSGSDADGTISTYQWTKISGPSTYNIVNSSSPTTDVSKLVQGVYQFQLNVTDNDGAVGSAIIKVIVNNAANKPPTANAGSNKTITLPANNVSLAGSGTDPDGTIVSYKWTKISGPSSFNIVNADSPTTNITGLTQGEYQFKLIITDNNGAIGTDAVRVRVNAAVNLPPTANAGPNQAITLPTNSVSLSGSGSDVDGTIASYKWTKISGPSAYNIVNPSSPVTDISSLVEGVYRFRFTVTDNNGAISTSTIWITVNAAANLPPTAIAGSNKSITLPVDSVSLAGSGTDPDGTIVSYKWTKISGPSSFEILNPDAAITNVSGLVQGVYQFQLTVTDNNGVIGIAVLRITVNPAANVPPTASAGSSQTITLPINRVSLSGTGFDSDGTITSYQWTKISGPSSFNIVNPASPVTDATGLMPGAYQFQLTVTDNKGDIGTATVQINVDAANIPPTANAGSNKSITLPTNNVSLTGSGSDVDGTIYSYTWTKISGPSAFNIVNPSSPVMAVSGLVEGTYQFELKVTDNRSGIGRDTVQVIVNAAINKLPVANASANKNITLPTNSVSLTGSGSDVDGTISSYTWTKISGPSAYNITNSSAAVTTVSGLVQGAYQFELKVTDNKSGVGKDTVQITVNAAANILPAANAGSDKTITLPTNSVSLSGSGSDKDGTISSYTWAKISGPSAYNIINSSSAVTIISNLVEGIYQFELKVTDNKNAIATDVVEIKVNKSNVTGTIPDTTPNILPVANAGNDTTAVFPVDSVDLNGSGTDADGKITGYLWTQVAGPSNSTLSTNNTASITVSNLIAGTYEFELKVTDSAGGEGRDTVKVTIALGRIGQENSGLKIYPNPVNTVTHLEVNTEADNTNVMIRITDLLGRPVYRKTFISTTRNVKEEIDMSNLTKGTYVITVFFDGIEKQSVKVVKL